MLPHPKLIVLLSFGLWASNALSAVNSEAGKTIMARGGVNAFSEPEHKRTLKRRSPVFSKDTVTTAEASAAQLRMEDGGMLALKANSRLVIQQYQASTDTASGNVVMQLVEGGLRAVTGSIKSKQDNYQLDTPVGSIGIRGTHFEVELIQGDLFLAVWDGAIDINVKSGSDSRPLSFGEGEDFSFGIIDSQGQVTQLLEAPDNFSTGHSQAIRQDQSSQQESGSDFAVASSTDDDDSTIIAQNSLSEASNNGSQDPAPITTEPVDDEVNEEVQQQVLEQNQQAAIEGFYVPATPEVVASRQGAASFNTLIESSLSGSGSNLGELAVNMTIDFDEGTIPKGELSVSDNGGEWFAAFNGLIYQNRLELGVNFATHGNALATGHIEGLFTDESDKVSGQFHLQEQDAADTYINGEFLIR